MSETGFLAAVEAFLEDAALTPAPALIGPAEPSAAAELPAVVLSLAEVRRLGAGLGESALITDSALAVEARVDLADPFLPGLPGFSLVSADRRTLILPHGGQVRADASLGALGPGDLQVTVAGAPRTVVADPPGPGEVRADRVEGILTFGEPPLPPAGLVIANYFLGQWERRITPLAGRLSIDVLAAGVADLRALSDAVAERLLAGASERSFRGLRGLALAALGPMAAPDAGRFDARARTLVFDFDYEHVTDRAESSGGPIRRVPIVTDLELARIDPASSGIVFETEREESG